MASHYRPLLSKQWKKRFNSCGNWKSALHGAGRGAPTAQHRRGEFSPVEGKVTLGLEVWGGRQLVDHVPDPHTCRVTQGYRALC